jgi:hypothetical protein
MGLVTCPGCHSLQLDGQATCPMCGTPLPEGEGFSTDAQVLASTPVGTEPGARIASSRVGRAAAPLPQAAPAAHPPVYSADGRFWFDGSGWRPVAGSGRARGFSSGLPAGTTTKRANSGCRSCVFAISVLGVIVVVLGIIGAQHPRVPSTPVAMGTLVDVSGATGADDLVTVTVESYESPVRAVPPVPPAPSATQYAVVAVQGCTKSFSSTTGLDPAAFSVELSDGTTASQVSQELAVPQLQPGPLAAHSCAHGFVSFIVPAGVTPVHVTWTGRGTRADTVRWQI